jgi:hypothetical protein
LQSRWETLPDEQVTNTAQAYPQAAHKPAHDTAADHPLADGELVLSAACFTNAVTSWLMALGIAS